MYWMTTPVCAAPLYKTAGLDPPVTSVVFTGASVGCGNMDAARSTVPASLSAYTYMNRPSELLVPMVVPLGMSSEVAPVTLSDVTAPDVAVGFLNFRITGPVAVGAETPSACRNV